MTDTPNTSADERERMARVVAGHGFDKVAAMLRADAATIAEQQATIERLTAEIARTADEFNALSEERDSLRARLDASKDVMLIARNVFEGMAAFYRELGAALASTNRSDAAGEVK